MIKVNYVGKLIGDFKVKTLECTRNYIAIYKAKCIKCGYEKISPIWTIKHNCECYKCKKAKNDHDKFSLVKDKVFKEFKIIDYKYRYNSLFYRAECIYCGKKQWLPCSNLDGISHCSCRHHENGKLYAKHHNEKVGDYILIDSGKNAYNSRNRLYQAKCIYCGKIKQGQYSDLLRRDLCDCHK